MSSHFKEHIPNGIDKQLLVWYKKYPSKEQIPASVNEAMMKKVHNRARVHGSLIMMGLAVVGYIGVVFSAKKAVARGESVDRLNEQFHKDYFERQKK